MSLGVGVSESGAETSKIQVLRDDGMNVFRIPFLMERLAPNQVTGSLDATYLKDLKSVRPHQMDGHTILTNASVDCPSRH